jgi:hypothetical protein
MDNLCFQSDPDLVKIYGFCNARHTNEVCGSWKVLLRDRITSMFLPIGVNQRLQKNFETVFHHEGIIAFSNCDTTCTDSYQDAPDFILRERGVKFFKLFLNGINYDSHFLDGVFVVYTDLKYLLDHWNAECDIIRRWCGVLGLPEGSYTINKPKSDMECIFVEFGNILELEEDKVIVPDDMDEKLPTSWMDWEHSFDSFSYELIESGEYC